MAAERGRLRKTTDAARRFPTPAKRVIRNVTLSRVLWIPRRGRQTDTAVAAAKHAPQRSRVSQTERKDDTITQSRITLRQRILLAAACSMVLAGALLGAESEESPTPASPTLDELLLFRPTRFPQGEWEPQNLTYEDVWFEAADNVKLHGWYCPHDDPVAAVLYIHGTGGNLSDRRFLVKSLQTELRLSVFIFDYRGYGRSEGVPSVKGALQDAAAARRELARLADVGEGDVVLMGRSLGGAVAIQLAADAAPRGLVVESSFSSLKEMANLHFPNLACVVPADKLNSVAAIKKYHGPYLQSHGDADALIPYRFGKKLFEAANQPKRFIRIRRANHNDPQSQDYYQVLRRFLHKLPRS